MRYQADNTDSGENLIRAAEEILGQGIALLESITDEQFTTPVAPAFNASLGAHYRHSLDHFSGFLAGMDEGMIDYDQRARNVVLESDRFAALNKTRELKTRIEGLVGDTLSGEVVVCSKLRYADGNAQSVKATVARELMYVITHAMHHYALIRVMGNLLEVKVPAHFGYAPSTIDHERKQAEKTTA
ncbi:MAG: hypothetical protein ACPGVU_26595 [Limisphaerales bacterium]